MNMKLLQRLSSPILALAFFPLMAISAIAAAKQLASPTLLMTPPFVLLGVNLGAAIVTRPRFRADLWLLLFHLALLVLILLLVVARLTFFEAKTPIARGMAFDGYVERVAAGFFHGDRYRALKFENAGFTERSSQGAYAGSILNRIRWRNREAGGSSWHEAEIADDRPLILDGYRIYPTNAKGLAPVLVWEAADGATVTGTMQLPALAASEFQKGAQWQVEHGPVLWAWINVSPNDPATDRDDLGVRTLDHVLVIREGDARYELRPGQTASLPKGRLHYLRLESWISYHIIYDPTRPWVVATVMIAVFSLVAYYARRLGRSMASGALE